MLVYLYGLSTLMVLALALGPLLRDSANPKAEPQTWLFLALALALSPITLPNMVMQRLYRRRLRRASEYNASLGHGVQIWS